MALADNIIGVESGGNRFARNPRSSASGPGQFIDSTWLAMLAKHRPDIAAGKTPEELLALKSDPGIAREMTEAYAADNGSILANKGLPVTPGTQYLAHFAGPQGAVGILNADPSLPAGSILGEAAMKANPFLQGMTAGDLRTWAENKMSGGSAAPAPQSPSSGPLQIAPQQQAAPFSLAAIPQQQNTLASVLSNFAQKPPDISDPLLQAPRRAALKLQQPATPGGLFSAWG